METLLLQTKFYIPPSRPELIPRPHLTKRLNEGQARKLTLICAPAGFGKTTLLSEWVRGSELPTAWLSLDEGDDDPARFLVYFVTALQTIAPNIGENILSVLQSPQPPPIESVLTALINEIAEIADNPSTPPMVAGRGFTLVLDDYHVIEAQPIDQALAFLLDHLPPQMHLVIASRANPSLPLPRLRARGEMIELRADDLRFTPDEATTFLNQMTGLDFSVEDVTALETRTEGWIAGLQLAALSMRGTADIPGFIATFTGSNRYIIDYLTDEVLRQRPEGTRDFLLQTSILNRLTAPLCDAVTGQYNGQIILEKLEDANLFLIPLDNERRWYRYHHLFADLLRQRLHQQQPDNVADLPIRASAWYKKWPGDRSFAP